MFILARWYANQPQRLMGFIFISVDNIPKCGAKDTDCHRQSFQYVIREGSKTGIPEANIAPFDPLELKQELNIPIRDIVQLHFGDGVVKGLSKCVINDFV